MSFCVMCVCGVVQRERESEHRRELDDGSFLNILTPLDRVSCLHACCRMVTDDALSVTGGVENPTVWSKEGTLLLSKPSSRRKVHLPSEMAAATTCSGGVGHSDGRIGAYYVVHVLLKKPTPCVSLGI